MKTLLVMRHGKSDWSGAEGTPDIDRPLTRRGKKDAESMSAQLTRLGQIPDLVVHSPARRCRSTVKRLVKSWPEPIRIGDDERLYMHGVAGCVDVLAGLPDESQRALLVGHNPTLEELVRLLTSRWVTLATSTVACLELPVESWQDVATLPTARLCFVMGPDGSMLADTEGPAPD